MPSIIRFLSMNIDVLIPIHEIRPKTGNSTNKHQAQIWLLIERKSENFLERTCAVMMTPRVNICVKSLQFEYGNYYTSNKIERKMHIDVSSHQ